MFREGQYRRPVFEQRLRELYVTALERVLGRRVTEAEFVVAYFLMGLSHYLGIEVLFWFARGGLSTVGRGTGCAGGTRNRRCVTIRIVGTGLYAPGEAIDNVELKELAGVAFDAARAAIADAGIQPDEVDFLSWAPIRRCGGCLQHARLFPSR